MPLNMMVVVIRILHSKLGRFILVRRVCLIVGLLYGYRALTMIITVLPAANPDYLCDPQVLIFYQSHNSRSKQRITSQESHKDIISAESYNKRRRSCAPSGQNHLWLRFEHQWAYRRSFGVERLRRMLVGGSCRPHELGPLPGTLSHGR